MSVLAGAARAYPLPASRQNPRAELPDQPRDDDPPAHEVPVAWRLEPVNVYRVLSARGLTLGKFDNLAAAIEALNCWSQAVALVDGTRVHARKVGAK